MKPAKRAIALVSAAATALKSRRDDVNKLNVFPVPDGDTGTNMSLTMDAVVAELDHLADDATTADVCRAITHASLMGARGNSGVILSQVLRGICDVAGEAETFDTPFVAEALERSVTVAFQAVRRPVEGTMLTVLRDASETASAAAKEGQALADALAAVSRAAFESVRRTPELLPVLKENGVVDAGGFGLAILGEGFVAALAGHEAHITDFAAEATLELHVEPANDWDDTEYLYCTEFLLLGHDLDKDAMLAYVGSIGGSELVVGDSSELKIHVHTDDPAAVLAHATTLGEVAEVHINNMRKQTAARAEGLRAEARAEAAVADLRGAARRRKPIGFVTVAAGQGLKDILSSLGADVIVNGGQTMNPSTAELLDAVREVDADSVVILPNNRNIVMAAQQVVSLADRPVSVVPTDSVPQAFAALLAYDGAGDLREVTEAMTQAACTVRTGEVTTAVKDAVGKTGPIRNGQVIGIADHEIEVTGDDVVEVAVELASHLVDGAETLTVLAGSDLSDDDLAKLGERLKAGFPELELETHRGDQPLYPVILAAE
jgi:DAK2 domain fusion protein YloV